LLTGQAPSLPERWLRRIEVDAAGCWLWTGYIAPNGYGRTSFGQQRGAYVHRVVYEVLVGLIPPGLHLDHLCRVRHCVNPDHLEPVTPGENVRRGANATKTCCINGHAYTPDNTRHQKAGRYCVTCNRERQYRNRKRREALSKEAE
jgi:hypothetical protein